MSDSPNTQDLRCPHCGTILTIGPPLLVSPLALAIGRTSILRLAGPLAGIVFRWLDQRGEPDAPDMQCTICHADLNVIADLDAVGQIVSFVLSLAVVLFLAVGLAVAHWLAWVFVLAGLVAVLALGLMFESRHARWYLEAATR